MKKYNLYLALFALIFFASTSCESEVDNSIDDWKIANQQALATVKNNPEYKELPSPGNEGSIYYKVLKKGAGKDSIYYTGIVEVYSKGWFVAPYPKYSITEGQEFQHWLFDDGLPFATIVSSSQTYLSKGVMVALQNMVEGDKWEIWVPYQLGGGALEATLPYDLSVRSYVATLPPYSVLVFEIEVVKVRKD